MRGFAILEFIGFLLVAGGVVGAIAVGDMMSLPGAVTGIGLAVFIAGRFR